MGSSIVRPVQWIGQLCHCVELVYLCLWMSITLLLSSDDPPQLGRSASPGRQRLLDRPFYIPIKTLHYSEASDVLIYKSI